MAKIINQTTTNIAKSVQKAISDAADESNNPKIVITSGFRSPKDQASAMAENLYNGRFIPYKEAGQRVVNVFHINKHKLSKNEVIELMEEKIIELTKQGKRVSNHCVTAEQYKECNILDISVRPENLPNPRDFVRALIKNVKLVKVITPFVDADYKDSRVLKTLDEPCIHIEIKA